MEVPVTKKLSACLIILIVLGVTTVPVALADPGSPMSLSNTASPDPANSGGQITYTISMGNTGGSKLTNVVLTDQLNGVGGIGVPPQLQITSTRGSCTQSTTLVTCQGGTIEGRGAWVVTIRGIVIAPSGTVLNNTASLGGTHTAQNFTTTTTTNTLVAGGTGSPLPDLTISKLGPTSVQASTPMTYTLTVNNQGGQNATGVKVVDTVPAGLSGVSATGTSLFVCSVAGLTVTCNGGAVNQGSNATITINATAPSALGTITNTAVVDPDNTIAESNELNNTSALVNTQVTAAPPPPQLSIDLTDNPSIIPGAGPDPVNPGGVLTYKIFVQNTTSQRADDVVVVDGTQGFVSSNVQASFVVTNGAIGNTGGCVVTASQAKCSVRTLNAGGTIMMTVTGSVIASAGSTILNTATVTGNIKNTGTSTTDTERTTVKPDIDLTITKADSPDPVCASSWPSPVPRVCAGGLTYTYVVGNSGVTTATGVVIRDPLPAGTFYDAASTSAPAFSGGCSVDASNVLTCTGGIIPFESTTTVKVTLVAPPGTGTISNTVTVDPNNAIFEADETNNTATATTQVITGIDLVINKVDSPPGFDPIATSGTQTYTITVQDIGTQDVTNIRVRDTLPASTTFLTASGDHGFTCSASAGVVDCVGGSLRGTASEFYPPFGAPGADVATIIVKIFATPFAGIMHNEVRVDPLNEIPEANELNNIAFQDTVVGSFPSGNGAFNQLTISKTQVSPPNPVARNAKVTWTILVGNTGTNQAVGVTVRDFLPAGSQYIQATGDHQFNCSQVGGHIDCVGGEIPANATAPPFAATITVTAFAPDTPANYINQAIVDPNNTIPEGDELDNEAQAPLVVVNHGNGPFYDLSITKTQLTPGNPVARNAIVTYSIVVTNGGSDPVIGVKVRDTLPAGSRYIQATGTNQFLCTNSAGIVDCIGGQISSGGSATITVRMFAPDTPSPSGVPYTNQAIVDPDNTIPEGDELNNQATADTFVIDGGAGAFNDLQVSSDPPSQPTNPGRQVNITLKVWNNGSDPASNVTVRDVLPVGLAFVSAADAGGPGGAFNCSNSGSVITCTGGTILPGGPGTGRFIGIVATAPQQVGTLQNNVVVDPDNTIPEGNETNNTASSTVIVSAAFNLRIEKDGPKTATQSDVTAYTLKVFNEAVGGPGEILHQVHVIDPLPVGLIPLTTETDNPSNWQCSISQNPINLVECVGDLNASGAGSSVTITINVFITADGGPLDNVACVDDNNKFVESNEGDNCSEFGTFVSPPPPNSPDLQVSKSVDKTATAPDDDLTYHVSISNVGTAKAQGWNGTTGLTVTDTLSSELTFTNATGSNGWTCTEAAGVVTCHDDGSGMDVGANAQITILAHVKTTATVPVINTASAVPALVDPQPPTATSVDETPDHLANNTSSVTSSMAGSGFDLAIASVTDNPDPVSPGQGLKYTIVAVNAGTSTANGVQIQIDLPTAGVTFTGANASNGFSCVPSIPPAGATVLCTGNLAGGGNTTITISLITLLSALPGNISLTATIDPGNAFAESNEGNNTITQPTTISTGTTCSGCVDLVASQLITSPEPLSTGGSLTTTFQVVNTGDTPTTLNPASDTLLSLVVSSDGTVGAPSTLAASEPGFPCFVDALASTPNMLVTFCRGNLLPAQGVTITLVAPVTGTGAAAIGTADPNSLVPELGFEGNNQLIQTVIIVP